MAPSAHVIFTVEEVAGGEFIIKLEPVDQNLPSLGKGFLAFDLSDGTTFNKAEEFAALLQENITGISYRPAS
ncbi:MAG: hypothetical protein ABW172_02105 [Candidatus Binatia bacterium]|jgi:hypothetical protein